MTWKVYIKAALPSLSGPSSDAVSLLLNLSPLSGSSLSDCEEVFIIWGGQVAGLWVRMLCRNFPCFAMFAMFVNNFAAFSFQFFDFVPTLLLISLPILMNTWAFWLHLQAELEYCLPPSTSCSIVHCSFLKSGWLPRISLLLLAFIKRDLIKSRSLPTSTRSLWNTKWKVCLLRLYCPPSIPHD